MYFPLVSISSFALLAIPYALIFCWLFTHSFRRKLHPKRHPLPPGPSRWPIIGNVFDIPRAKEWITFAAWRKIYGNVISVSTFGRSIIILNSAKAAIDLLEKRSAIYSDRPYMVMVGDLVGYDHTLPLTPYNARFRETRRLAKGVLGPGVVGVFEQLVEKECARFLERLLDAPEEFLAHIRHTTGAIILSITYGYDVSDSAGNPDPMVKLAATTVEEFSKAVVPGGFLVDLIPWLKYIPASLPGMGFRRVAVVWRQHLYEMAELPYQFTKSQMKEGMARTSFVSTLLESEENCTPEMEDIIKWAALSLFAGGADPAVSSLSSFFLAMCTHPRVQLAAQAEIDSVVGSERLPSISDRAKLPYIDAIVKEVLRWAPVGPLGLPHRVMEEDVYEGYRIPAGSVVIPNIWEMMYDPEIYPNPHEFQPERFLSAKALDGVGANPSQLAFGFGRRVCPGQYLAEPFLFLCITMTLATFNIIKALDEYNGVVEPGLEWSTGTVSHPKPFKSLVKPRSEEAANLIRRMRMGRNDEF